MTDKNCINTGCPEEIVIAAPKGTQICIQHKTCEEAAGEKAAEKSTEETGSGKTLLDEEKQ